MHSNPPAEYLATVARLPSPDGRLGAGEGGKLSNNETTKARHSALPPMLAPRGLRRTEAAAYIGMSPSLFDRMVAENTMPKPKRVGARTVWDRWEIDEAFSAIPNDGEEKPVPSYPWDAMSNEGYSPPKKVKRKEEP